MTARATPIAILSLAALTFVGLASPVSSRAAGEQIPRSVVSAGATSATTAGVQLVGTLGQLAVGTSSASALAAGHGYWTVAAQPVLAVDPGLPREVPAALEFGAPAPNPSQGSIAFDVGLPRAGRVELRVLDLQGRSVSAPTSRSLPVGRHRLVITPAGDAPLGPGVYFAQLRVDGRVAGTRRFVRVR